MTDKPVLNVKQLRVQINTPNGIVRAVDGVDIAINKGEIFALVGESGCGKSMTALSISRLLPDNAHICEGSEIYFEDIGLHLLSENQMRFIRRNKIGMIFQDPATALNPVMTVGEQVMEAINNGNGTSKKASTLKSQVLDILEKVRLPSPHTILHQYPHQLSGGLKQRVVIAIALAHSPSLLIADEATTALDVTTQAQVLGLIKELNKTLNMAILLITHDLGIVAQLADKVAVMYAGHIIESSSIDEFLNSPLHPYSKQLFAALPENTRHGDELTVIPGHVPSLNRTFSLCRFKERCKFSFSACEHTKPEFVPLKADHSVRCHWYDEKIMKKIPTRLRIESLISDINLKSPTSDIQVKSESLPLDAPLLNVKDLNVHFPVKKGFFKKTIGYIKAVDGVSFCLSEGQTLALVGESGCGKTTVGKAILRLVNTTKGSVYFNDVNLLKLKGSKLREKRSELQMIFQDPYSSMDPRMRLTDIIEEGMIALKIGSNAKERQDRIDVLLEQVGLSAALKDRFAHELSGGQRQRVAIARALAVGANLIICDEPTSALDVSVQAQILNLLKSLQNDLSISFLFITHNIGVVNYLADFVAVMYLGRIVEYGPAQEVLRAPKHPYTQALLASVPKLEKHSDYFKAPKGELPSPLHPPRGCHFSPRCPKVHERCLEKYPDSYSVGEEHETRCYLFSPEEINMETTNERETKEISN